MEECIVVSEYFSNNEDELRTEKSYLIILGAGPQQIPAYKKARLLGINTVAVDFNTNAVARKFADEFLLASIKDSEECLYALRTAKLKYMGVIAYGVEISPICSAIAKEFNLKSVSGETAFNTTNKCGRSMVLRQHSIPIPNFIVLNQFSPPPIDFPFVVKPSDNSGSRGVQIVKSLNEWEDAYNEAVLFSSDGNVVVEELLIGDEISIEGHVINNKMYVYGFTDRNYIRDGSYDPYFMEDGSSSPSNLSPEIIEEAKEVFSNAAIALGITEGPSKGDLIVTKSGVKVLEITSRLSPGFSMFSPQVYGVDPLKLTIEWAIGKKIRPSSLIPKFQKGMAHRYYYHQSGKIKSITGLSNLKEQPGIHTVVQLMQIKVGQVLEKPTYINRIFYVVTVSDNRESAILLAEEALDTVKIDTE